MVRHLTAILLAVTIVLMLRSSVIEAFKIPSESMIPTLLIGDHIFVNKFEYGLRVPFQGAPVTAPSLPRRGDIIVFRYPKDEAYFYIKRVIGRPGDKIQVKSRQLWINDRKIEAEPILGAAAEELFRKLDNPRYNSSTFEPMLEHLETDGKADHVILLDKNIAMNENFGPKVVPPDSLFVMGDNRDFSNDSRFWGFVPLANIRGKAMFIWLSLWLNLEDSQFIFRPDRIGTPLR